MKSFANGNGGSHANGATDGGPVMQLGSPVPPSFRNWEWLFAHAVSASSWDFQ